MNTKKKITLPIKIIIIFTIIGLVFCGIGLVKQNLAKKTNEDRKAAALKESQKKVDAANARLKEIETQLTTLNKQHSDKKAECNTINMLDPKWYECEEERASIGVKINKLEDEQTVLEKADYTVYYDIVEPMSYNIFYIIGGSVVGVGLLGAFIIYLVKGKKTYLPETEVPASQSTTEQVSPTISENVEEQSSQDPSNNGLNM